ILRTSARRAPEKEALVHGNQRLSYQEVARRPAVLAQVLREAGLQRGDRVAIYLDASVPQVISIFGVSEAAGVFVPINSLLHPEQVAYISKDCSVRAMITTPAKLAQLAGHLDQIPSLQFIIVSGEGDVPALSLPILRFDELCNFSPA